MILDFEIFEKLGNFDFIYLDTKENPHIFKDGLFGFWMIGNEKYVSAPLWLVFLSLK